MISRIFSKSQSNKNLRKSIDEVPLINAYNQDLTVLFHLNHDSCDISKDFLIMLKSSDATSESLLVGDTFERVLINSIRLVQTTKKPHSFSQTIKSGRQLINISIQLNYQQELEGKSIDQASEHEGYMELISSIRSIRINQSMESSNELESKHDFAIYHSIDIERDEEDGLEFSEGS